MTIISSAPTSNFLAVCEPCRRPRRFESTADSRYATVTCAECGRATRGERIHATVSAAGCNDQCQYAVKDVCSCACDGANHGRQWIEEEGEMLEGALAKYRAEQDAKEAARKRREAAKLAKAVAAFNEWVNDNDAADTLAWLAETSIDHPFIEDMAHRVGAYKPLTPRQLAAVEKFADNDRDRKARAEAEADEVHRPVPTGKAIEVTGTIVHVKAHETYYGHRTQTTWKMLVKGEGWKIWSTVPSGLQPSDYREWRSLIDGGFKGRGVTFTADVAASDADESFGFAKRPRKATLLAA